jgi:hypothetical protein
MALVIRYFKYLVIGDFPNLPGIANRSYASRLTLYSQKVNQHKSAHHDKSC